MKKNRGIYKEILAKVWNLSRFLLYLPSVCDRAGLGLFEVATMQGNKNV